MKTTRNFLLLSSLAFILIGGSSCKLWNNAFGPKYGCPANGKAVGAERILSGEKVPKAKKFKA
jgi:hypothetical protein